MSIKLGNTTIAGATIQLGQPLNIGQIIPSALPLQDAGLHLLDGSLIQGNGIYSAFVTYIAGLVSTYPDLFETEANWQTAVTNYGVCGKFVYDSTNNTVRLPKITGIVEGTTDVSALGDLVEAGLPNITGAETGVGCGASAGASGAFGWTDTGNATLGSSGGSNYATYDFNANRSSDIYGNSSTVQPQTIKVLYYIVIATSTKTEIQVDIDEIVTDLNGKADRDGSNMVSSVKKIDGQWVNSLIMLSTSKTIGEYTIDVSNYLPDAIYDYDIKIKFYAYSSASGESVYSFSSDILTSADTNNWGYTNSNSRAMCNTFDMPVGVGRYIKFTIENTNANDIKVEALGYRRIGTNS